MKRIDRTNYIYFDDLSNLNSFVLTAIIPCFHQIVQRCE